MPVELGTTAFGEHGVSQYSRGRTNQEAAVREAGARLRLDQRELVEAWVKGLAAGRRTSRGQILTAHEGIGREEPWGRLHCTAEGKVPDSPGRA